MSYTLREHRRGIWVIFLRELRVLREEDLLACWGLTQVWSQSAKQIPVLLALSETFHGVRTEVSPEVVWGGLGTRFLHP